MAYLTGLARVAKTTGYRVVEVAGWKTRGHGSMSTIKTIVCHHTAGGRSGNAGSLNVVTHGRTGLPGPLSQYVLGRDGTIYVVAAGISWHAGATRKTAYNNSHAIGIEAENTGVGEKWSDAQLDSYVKLCAALVKEFRLSVNDVLGHKEICFPVGRKIDPNFSANKIDMNDFRSYVRAGRYKKSAPAKVKPAKTPSKAPVKKPVVVAGNASVKAAQTILKGLGYYSGLLDGVNGSMTKAAVKKYQANQKYFPGMRVDGSWGSMTQAHYVWAKSLQKAMNKWAGKNILVDGDLGKLSIDRVREVMSRNKGGTYKGIVDGVPGAMFSKMLGIKKHPSA